MPAASIPTTRRMFERLKIAPLTRAGMTNRVFESVKIRAALMPEEPLLPSVAANSRLKTKTPIA